MAHELVTRLRQVVADVLGVPFQELALNTSHKDVPAWDSLNIVKLAMAIEAEFRVVITPDDAMNFTSVGEILKVLESKGRHGSRSI
jgi:acyl carrier protein